MNALITIGAVLALLLSVGGLIGLARREVFSLRWLIAAAGLVLMNDFLLMRGYGSLPNLLHLSYCSWQGSTDPHRG